MSLARVVGIALVVAGALFVSRGYSAQPRDTVAIVAGVLFVAAGVLRMRRGRGR